MQLQVSLDVFSLFPIDDADIQKMTVWEVAIRKQETKMNEVLVKKIICITCRLCFYVSVYLKSNDYQLNIHYDNVLLLGSIYNFIGKQLSNRN